MFWNRKKDRPAAICYVAQHAWVEQRDAWGSWRKCQRCGALYESAPAFSASTTVTV